VSRGAAAATRQGLLSVQQRWLRVDRLATASIDYTYTALTTTHIHKQHVRLSRKEKLHVGSEDIGSALAHGQTAEYSLLLPRSLAGSPGLARGEKGYRTQSCWCPPPDEWPGPVVGVSCLLVRDACPRRGGPLDYPHRSPHLLQPCMTHGRSFLSGVSQAG
jgi:hypothetical protein